MTTTRLTGLVDTPTPPPCVTLLQTLESRVSERKIVVIGGGVVGVCAAYELARSGVAVTLLESGEIGHGASFGNGGLIALGHTPLCRPAALRGMPKWLIDRSGPTWIAPRLDLSLALWLWRFRRCCSSDHLASCMEKLADLGRRSMACFERIISDESLDCDFTKNGLLEVYETEHALRHGREEADFIARFGFEIEQWTGSQLGAREPTYRSDLAGAFCYTASGFADPYRFVTQTAQAAARHGATILPRTAARGFEHRQGRIAAVIGQHGERFDADAVIIACGIWSTPIARLIGESIPMQAAKGYHINLRERETAFGETPLEIPLPQRAAVLAESTVAVTPLSSGLRLAGTVEFGGLNRRINRHRIGLLQRGARRCLRFIDDMEIASEWVGLRPCTADGMPIIRWSHREKNVFIATGGAKLGFQLGPIMGAIAAESVTSTKREAVV